MLDTGIAYLLWAAGFMLGFPGFHRLYMRKYNRGTALRFIPGLGHVIALFDLFALPAQIREANLRAKYRAALQGGRRAPGRGAERVSLPADRESPERVVLRTAKKNRGIITPGEAALEGDISLTEAKKLLDDLAAKGFSEMRVKKSGVVVYTFPEFMDHGEDEKLLDI